VPGIWLVGGERKLTAARIAFKQEFTSFLRLIQRNEVVTAERSACASGCR